MILESSNFTIDLFEEIPNYKLIASEVWQHHYAELYEPEATGEIELQEDLERILDLLESENPAITHLRYVWMALILALTVKPTMNYYFPDYPIAEKIIAQIEMWLVEAIERVLICENPSLESISIKTQENRLVPDPIIGSFPEKIASFQIPYEALDVYQNAIKTLDRDKSSEALLEILDDCLEGYAIFPGSQGRRELFNWWLLDVVLASLHLCLPNAIYEVEEVSVKENTELRPMEILTRIHAKMKLVILIQKASKNKYNSYENEIKVNIKPLSTFNIHSDSLSKKMQPNTQLPHRKSNFSQESSWSFFQNTIGEKYERTARR